MQRDVFSGRHTASIGDFVGIGIVQIANAAFSAMSQQPETWREVRTCIHGKKGAFGLKSSKEQQIFFEDDALCCLFARISGNICEFLLSLPVRGAWIEIRAAIIYRAPNGVAPRAGSV
ncbi:MAG: hypothetical protein RSG59_06165, partial [Ruthenibacterium sp.]